MADAPWNILRTWHLDADENDEHQTYATRDLAQFRSVAMLGAAGLGKTFEAQVLAEYERSLGRDVRWCRLAEFAGTTDQLERRLVELSANASSSTTIILDALDEAMVPLRRCWKTVEQWVSSPQGPGMSHLRITCRPAVWQPGLATAMAALDPQASHAVATLRPLGESDIRGAASASGLDADAFLREIENRRAETLATHPLTFGMLLRVKLAGAHLPSSLRELFERAVQELAADRHERFILETQVPRSVDEILRTAESVACHTVLSGRHRVSLLDSATPESLPWPELSPEAQPDPDLHREAMHALACCGLCDSRSAGEFGFVHRQIAEYLAGRRIARMLPHQARSLLATPAGWRLGVAGPLRETTAFAAMSAPGIAEWITAHDPEVVGASDVADPELRRSAVRCLLERFRSGAMTDAQVGRGEIELGGFEFPGIEAELRLALAERGAGAADVLECAIEIIEACSLATMDNDLATVMLDPAAPLHPRITAGYALLKLGSDDAQARLLPLLVGDPGDEHNELKALAVRCNWPERITSADLLAALTGRPSNFHGAFDGLLIHLDSEAYDATGARLAGLRWAATNLKEHGDSDPAHRIATRIVHAAVQELADPETADALCDLLLVRAAAHSSSPLEPLGNTSFNKKELPPDLPAPLVGNKQVRRDLIDALAHRAPDPRDLGSLARHTQGMCDLDDFTWLLKRASSMELTAIQREGYAEIARWLPWNKSLKCRLAWWPLRNTEPIASSLAWRVARTPREWVGMRYARLKFWFERQHDKWKYRPKRVKPSPARRVRLALAQCREQPIAFQSLTQQLTLEPKSTHYGYSRFVTKTPGWQTASERTRSWIVDAAKTFLATQESYPENATDLPLNEGMSAGMAAIWLLVERDIEWLRSRDVSWWDRWAWYIIRELHPNMHDEPEEPKSRLLALLREKAPHAAATHIVRTATVMEGADSLLISTLSLLDRLPDVPLDDAIVGALRTRQVRAEYISSLSEFVLVRDPERALPVVESLLQNDDGSVAESLAVPAAVALLSRCPQAAWIPLTHLFAAHPSIAKEVLSQIAHGQRLRLRSDQGSDPISLLSAEQLGQLTAFLLELFAPEDDPEHDGAYFVGQDDSARDLRDRLIRMLGDRADAPAVEVMLWLETRFGARYPWLRRPRARAQANHRLSKWTPLATSVIADLLSSDQRRLVRSADDVVEGVITAVEQYERSLRTDGPDSVEDLWNILAGAAPTPKPEEHVSRKIGGVVREYFRDYAVTADREVEIRIRTVPRAQSGQPGEKLDVLVQAPARGTVSGETVRVPIEVKLSGNREVTTAMNDQLAERYMATLGSTHGVYVVAWMSVPTPKNLAAHHRPQWPTIDDARGALDAQAEDIKSRTGRVTIPTILDATIR